ncbi:MAG: hypothetical protein ABSA77_12505 [Thermoguttaceae bacterium]
MNPPNAFAARALPSRTRMLVEPNDIPPPYQGTSMAIFCLESLRRLSSNLVDISSRLRSAGLVFGSRNRRRSKPPPEAPISLSKCGPGARPVSAIYQLLTSKSGVQR